MKDKITKENAYAYWEQRHYWPFDVLGEDKQTEKDRLEIAFLEAAVSEGGNAYIDSVGNLGAENSSRSVMIIRHHSKKWELRMYAGDDPVISSSIESFKAASEIAIRWLKRGEIDLSIVNTAI